MIVFFYWLVTTTALLCAKIFNNVFWASKEIRSICHFKVSVNKFANSVSQVLHTRAHTHTLTHTHTHS